MEPDLIIDDQGSIILLRPNTSEGEGWIDDNIGPDNGYQPYYPAVIVEPRYLGNIVHGATEDGLVLRDTLGRIAAAVPA